MSTTDILEDRIEEEFNAVEQRIERFQVDAERDSKALAQRYERFEALRVRLRKEIFEPRLKKLLERFDNVETKLHRSRDGGELRLTFAATPQRPASVDVTFDLSHDGRVENVILQYHLRIVPLFLKIENNNPRFEFPLDRPDDQAIIVWLNDQIISFVRTYLSLQFINEYQKENLVTDVVMNIRFPKGMAKVTQQYLGNTYYFASQDSSSQFEKDPSKYATSG